MGSGQSSHSIGSGSFSIDPNGNISHASKKKPQAETSQEQNEHQDSMNSSNKDSSPAMVEAVNQNENQQTQLATLDIKPSGMNDLDLQEADEIVTRMKLKYKLNSNNSLARNRSAFEDIERNLAHCYNVNKNQPIKCSDITKEYHRIVKAHRTRLLEQGLNLPIVS